MTKNNAALWLAIGTAETEDALAMLPHLGPADLDELREGGFAANLLGDAARFKKPQLVEALIPLCDPNARDPVGHTPLMWAIGSGVARSVKLLLPVSDLTIASSAGLLPAELALAVGKPALADMVRAEIASRERAALAAGLAPAPTRSEQTSI